MLAIFKLDNNRLKKIDIESNNDVENFESSIWVDLIDPKDEEREFIRNKLGQILASRPELEDIEASARFFENEDGLHIHSFFFFHNSIERSGNSTVAFTIVDNRLYTLREKELLTFKLYFIRISKQKLINGNVYELFLDLFEIKVEQLADEIEHMYSSLEKLSKIIMEGQQGDEFDEALSILAELEDIGWKVRLCLMDSQRAINFLVRKANLQIKQREQSREILRDIESLLPHNESLFQKVNFLMQVAIGFISIEQNRIIKIFSVVSVVFLPPTLVASSYGMNFIFMPELKWIFGYPFAIILMIVAGLAPYFYFKQKNWL
ncbi:magnesium/cobalt transporter CorA [Candidatus Purcelliella pentastirinorum]|uniref:Magnesium transport protein CorA n=1 Tax=Candidatus Purcelliella pentastirinorum TaxID=472834 RepID=A0A346DZX5_9ENTR|nr:magnesium/cobalt transporter CorA [Candidatus Purcelliella pentastirinorum]AXN02280.1 Magnesium and cobalt transport protein CorA [Candidatus Purcelliella pentastirinorum]WDI78831.1 magnesium/cobalt transporter CorA [Candidatus Purcelliella pentastirinorum]WDR79964.1 magnesium/cobalt transporter CorA [Candidatus Purcelliella pentastirinorum]